MNSQQARRLHYILVQLAQLTQDVNDDELSRLFANLVSYQVRDRSRWRDVVNSNP